MHVSLCFFLDHSVLVNFCSHLDVCSATIRASLKKNKRKSYLMHLFFTLSRQNYNFEKLTVLLTMHKRRFTFCNHVTMKGGKTFIHLVRLSLCWSSWKGEFLKSLLNKPSGIKRYFLCLKGKKVKIQGSCLLKQVRLKILHYKLEGTEKIQTFYVINFWYKKRRAVGCE